MEWVFSYVLGYWEVRKGVYYILWYGGFFLKVCLGVVDILDWIEEWMGVEDVGMLRNLIVKWIR